MRRVLACFANGLALIALTACSTINDRPFVNLEARVTDSVTLTNQAYANGVNAMILQNVLRARDRLPRQYTALSGINDKRTYENTSQGIIANLPLGNDNDGLWGTGQLSSSYKRSQEPSFNITPLTEKALTEGLYNPIKRNIFEMFWNAGFPADVLLRLTVAKATKVEATSATGLEYYDRTRAAAVARDEIVQEMIYARYDRKHGNSVTLLDEFDVFGFTKCKQQGQLAGNTALSDKDRLDILEKIDKLGLTVERPAIGGGSILWKCPKQDDGIVYFKLSGPNVQQAVYKIQLRSLDSTIFYLGENVRPSAAPLRTTAGDCDLEALKYAAGIGNRKPDGVNCRADIPLFAARHERPRKGARYAASIIYAGETYVSGPPVDSSSDSYSDLKNPLNNENDRSATALTLIGELLFMSQSAELVKPPTRIETQ